MKEFLKELKNILVGIIIAVLGIYGGIATIVAVYFKDENKTLRERNREKTFPDYKTPNYQRYDFYKKEVNE